MSIRQLKSLSKIKGEEDFESKTLKQQQKIIAILMSQVSCERDAAEKALELQEKACLKQGKIVGKGGSRRRRRGRRSTASASDSGSDSDTSTSTQATAPPPPVQQTAQTAQAAPAQAAAAQEVGGDIYDLLSVIIVSGGAYMAGSYALAAGLDDGMTALMEANGVGSLQSCAPEEQLARKLNAAALGYQVPDYCNQAETNMNALIIAAPLAAASLCAYFGVRNPISILADTARSTQRRVADGLRNPVDTISAARDKVSEGLRKCFGRRARTPESVVNAANIAVQAQNAATTAARNSPNANIAQSNALQAGQQVVNPTITPSVTPTSPVAVPSPPRTVAQAMGNVPQQRTPPQQMLSPVAEGDTSPPALSSLSSTPQSPNYSPTTGLPRQILSASSSSSDDDDDDDDDDEEEEEEEGEVPTLVQAVGQSNTPTSVGSVSSVDNQGRSVRRSSRRRSGGKKKKARKTHKKKAKKARKARKSRKQKHKAKKTRKHKNKVHKTRKHKGKKKGKKTRKH